MTVPCLISTVVDPSVDSIVISSYIDGSIAAIYVYANSLSSISPLFNDFLLDTVIVDEAD